MPVVKTKKYKEAKKGRECDRTKPKKEKHMRRPHARIIVIAFIYFFVFLPAVQPMRPVEARTHMRIPIMFRY